ncbi:unnamed protein product [Rhizoctonia solani]|uniref:Zn(2)-C6 fungal-type domain-containing protein n=1 Tax=Rhizoctonia solani TaxID=456999 RepID=A0A8H3C033_9AGAM|nr:unnamed protein product [Rhizoctonia solani]
MLRYIPKRSTGGCLTCKRRKKKCDERRPHCRRCELGDFHCLGYEIPDNEYIAGVGHSDTQTGLLHWPPEVPAIPFGSGPSPQLLESLIQLPEYEGQVGHPSRNHALMQEVRNYLSGIPDHIRLDTVAAKDATSFILSQYSKFSHELMFRPLPNSIEEGLLWRIDDSNITRWSMYLVARMIKDTLSGKDVQKHLGWIFRFFEQILEVPSPTEHGLNLGARLGGLHDLLSLVFMVSGPAIGYSLFKRCTPVFLQLATLYPNIWSNDSTISILEAVQSSRYEISQFVINDTIVALVLGTPPLIHYETTLAWTAEAPAYYQLMCGFPIGVLLLLARVNAWRASQLMEQASQNQSDREEQLDSWNPTIDHGDGANNSITRFTIQEAWRQAAKIYLYMGMKDVNSADHRVERAVQQVVQLGSIIKVGTPLELHVVIPCLIAGVAARKEKHRAPLRRRIANNASQKLNTLMLRGSDFVTVLDHLWHGAGSEGRPVTWEDYVQSRFSVLPI